ncbi:MAG: AMP nucleosidase [Bacteroidetes bacterium]|nr:AMP nucleosidase [Bacteroidota bacterium]
MTDHNLPVSGNGESSIEGITRSVIGLDMLERYTGSDASEIQDYILLTNFSRYISEFETLFPGSVRRNGSAFTAVNWAEGGLSIIDYKIGSPTAALAIDLLSYRKPKAVLMLGLCGGLNKKLKIGDFVLPMAAIRDDGASNHYMPQRVPALPTFNIQKITSQVLDDQNLEFKTGVIHTTDYRFWEFDEVFVNKLKEERAIAIDMECATLFVVGFARKVPIGALMLVSDLPLTREGIKTKSSANQVFKEFTNLHLKSGIETLQTIRQQHNSLDLRHYEW